MPRAFQISRHAAATLAVMVLALPSLFPQPCHCPCCETRAPDAKVTASASDKTSCGQTKCPHCDREAPGKAGPSQSQGCCKNCTAGCSLDKPPTSSTGFDVGTLVVSPSAWSPSNAGRASQSPIFQACSAHRASDTSLTLFQRTSRAELRRCLSRIDFVRPFSRKRDIRSQVS